MAALVSSRFMRLYANFISEYVRVGERSWDSWVFQSQLVPRSFLFLLFSHASRDGDCLSTRLSWLLWTERHRCVAMMLAFHCNDCYYESILAAQEHHQLAKQYNSIWRTGTTALFLCFFFSGPFMVGFVESVDTTRKYLWKKGNFILKTEKNYCSAAAIVFWKRRFIQ